MNIQRHSVLLLTCCVMLTGRHVLAEDRAPGAVAGQLERKWRTIEEPSPRTSARDLFGFALEAAGNDWHPERVEHALGLAEQMQDRNPQSQSFGNFKWYWEAETPVDRNAVEFCMQKGVLLWIRYRDRMTPASIDRLQRLFQFSVEGIRQHHVSENYTNIFLMKTWNAIAIGEATERDDLANRGYQMLESWLLYTWKHGIHEYSSPTYYGVDLDSLGLIARFARRPSGRQAAEAALTLFWTDLAANWFAPCERLGGAHSRDYDYLTGHGYLDSYLRAAGWIQTPTPATRNIFQDSCHWDPPSEVHARFSKRLPRLVRQRWGSAPGQSATHFVGQRFSLGSAGANYGPMDKPLVVNVAGGPRTPMINFFMDGRNDPYGKRKIPRPSGHQKALHLTPFITSVQHGSEVLLLASIDPKSRASWRNSAEPTCLLSHLMLPDCLSVWIGDQTTSSKLEAPSIPLSPDTPVFLRLGDVAIGIRWVLALDCSGHPATIELVNDGARYGARRLTCVHASDSPEGQATVAVWVRVAEGLDNARFTQFRRNFCDAAANVDVTGDEVTIRTTGLEEPLELRADVVARKRIVPNVTDSKTDDLLFAVDGHDIGREILGHVACIARYERQFQAAQDGEPSAFRAENILEAESAQLITSPFQADPDQSASGGQFVWVPGEPGSAGSSYSAHARWLVHVPQPGAYHLWARVRAPTPSDDSFYVRILQDGRAVLPTVDWHTGVHKAWKWTPLRVGKERQVPEIPLEHGAVLIEFAGREDGTALDSLFLTANAEAKPVDF